MSVQTVNVLSYSLPLGFISCDEDTGVSNEMCDQEHTLIKGMAVYSMM